MSYRVVVAVLMTWLVFPPVLHAQDTPGQIVVTRAMLEGEGLETNTDIWTWVTPGRTYDYAVRWRDRSDKTGWHDHTFPERKLALLLDGEDGIIAGREYVFLVTATDTESSEEKRLRFVITAAEPTPGQIVVTRAMLEGEGLETDPAWTWVESDRTYDYAVRWRDRSDKTGWHDHTLAEADLPLSIGAAEELIADREYVFLVTATDTESDEIRRLRFVVTADEYTGMLLVGSPPNEIVALAEDAWSVEDFVEGLPKLHKEQALFMIASQAGDADFVDRQNPRIISWGATADILLSWGTNPQSPRYDTVEFIVPQDDEWIFGVVDFSDEAVTKVSTDTSCASCHAGHPLWASYPNWPGAMNGNARQMSPSDRNALWKTYAAHEDPRIAVLKGWINLEGWINLMGVDPIRIGRRWLGIYQLPDELGSSLALRHAEVLVNSLPPATFDTIAKTLICGGKSAIRQQFSVAERDLHVMADGTFVDPGDTSTDRRRFLTGNGRIIDEGVLMLLLKHFYDTNDAVKTLYQETVNTLSVPYRQAIPYLHFAPGTATAEDELLSRITAAFALQGEEQARARQAITRTSIGRQFVFGSGHTTVMAPKVCSVLNSSSDED